MGFVGSCETSTFGNEFVAMKQATEYVRGLRFKLRMMGITVDEPSYVFCDNQSVLANTSAPASTLKKKSNAIAYHFGRSERSSSVCYFITSDDGD